MTDSRAEIEELTAKHDFLEMHKKAKEIAATFQKRAYLCFT